VRFNYTAIVASPSLFSGHMVIKLPSKLL